MAERKNAGLRRSNKHLYDMNTGLPIMINLYVIKYLYYHIDKHNRFIESREKGKKPKAYPIYQNELPISRQRFDRINKGATFEVSTGESVFITDRYGIDIKYFRKDNPDTFAIEGITQTDWKCFYNHKYNVGYELPSGYNKEIIKTKAEKIEKVLKQIANSDWEDRIAKDNPLYAVCYYFHYGKRYDAPSNIDLLRERIHSVSFREWDSVDIQQLEKDCLIMEKHCKYIQSLITLNKLRKDN